MKDQRPDPKPRKHAVLWQSYLWWDELMQMRKKHDLRYDSAIKGKTKMDAVTEAQIIEWLSAMEKDAKKTMIAYGKQSGEIWDWLTGIKGIGKHTAAKLIALFDDPAKFETVSKFWRYSGWAVIDGRREYNKAGEQSHYNMRLKSECYLVGEQFIKHSTPLYRDLYDDEKVRLRTLHPEPVEVDGKKRYTDGHIHAMARRKVIKLFLQHLWVKWREFEGLPVSEPYAIAHLDKHTHYIAPPEAA